jgi:hypothetical protein
MDAAPTADRTGSVDADSERASADEKLAVAFRFAVAAVVVAVPTQVTVKFAVT